MAGVPSLENTEQYRRDGMTVVRRLLSSDALDVIIPYLDLLGHNGRFSVEAVQVPGSFVLYGDPLMDSILAALLPVASAVVGTDLEPAYSYVRFYRQGDSLDRHCDRPACEHSLTVHLSATGHEAWPVWFEDRSGRERSVLLEPGDGAFYQGCELTHWRDPCPMEWYSQTFLHYVDRHGPAAHHALDGRSSLGLPRRLGREDDR